MKDLTLLPPLLLKKFVKELMTDQLFKDRVVAVSYTHLDVYKRQTQ